MQTNTPFASLTVTTKKLILFTDVKIYNFTILIFMNTKNYFNILTEILNTIIIFVFSNVYI